ncbi:MAG: hypothetical protein GY712_12980 [Oceanicoccus sp.]|uniref:hypothetical protein n=1 Tax=Oceanicoccus sp. TaxID=2691044 RepID=UPI0026298590|nr:hypothetical protein [Oceanicoccus sp.]MCP3908917.1 hypothetical protein [Oceanicoccus sp.]
MDHSIRHCGLVYLSFHCRPDNDRGEVMTKTTLFKDICAIIVLTLLFIAANRFCWNLEQVCN